MKYTMRGIEYEVPKTIRDKDELRRLEWLMAHTRDTELRPTLDGLVSEYYGLQQQRKNQQWELLHYDGYRDLFIDDIKAVIRLYLEHGHKGLGKEIQKHFTDQEVFGVVYTNGRYWFEIWTIALILAGRKISDQEITYKLDDHVMEQFIKQGEQEHWYQDIEDTLNAEKRKVLRQQGVIVQRLDKQDRSNSL